VSTSPGQDGERRQITVFFSDLSGYTALTERLDPEDVSAVMDRVFAEATSVTERYGGRIDRFLGDAVMGVFGDRVSHEDDAERAVRAVIDLHRAVDELSNEIEDQLGRRITMHSGINTGVVVIGASLDTAVGDAINVASRLEDLSEPGEILIGPETANLVSAVFATEDRGEHSLKGKETPVRVIAVTGTRPTRSELSRRQARFVGRDEELSILEVAVEGLISGAPGVITIEAEAGAGKTRLMAELHNRLPDGARWLEGRAYSYGENIPYAAVIDLMSHTIGITEEDNPQTIESKLHGAVADIDGDTERLLAPFTRLFGIATPDGVALDRETYRERLLESVVALVAHLARRRPTVVAFQDLHWADPSTVELVRNAIGDIDEPILFIANYRPGFELGVAEARHIGLAEISELQAANLIGSLLDDQPVPDDLVEFIVGRTDGNPFFIEEIVNSLVETGAVTRTEDGWTTTEDLESIGLPTTIRGVIGARIDRFDDRRRRVLREAAVIGREFLYDVVADVTSVTDELDPSLRDLEAADLIREKVPDPDLEYFFKHALTQEVAYEGLLKAERQQLHARAAAAIERQFAGRLEEVVETLAYHYGESGITERAVHYLRAAGGKAVERFALAESRVHYSQAYELLEAEPQTAETDLALVDLVLDWAFLAYYQARLADVLDLLVRHQDAVERVADIERLGMWTGWVGHCQYMANGEFRQSLETLDRAVELGERAGSSRVIAYAQAWRIFPLWFLGRYGEAEHAGTVAGEMARDLPDEPYPWIKSRLGLGSTLSMRGEFSSARAIGEELVAFGETRGNARAKAMGHAVLANIGDAVMDDQAVRSSYRAVVDAGVDPIYFTPLDPWMLSDLLTVGAFEEARAFHDEHVATYVDELHIWITKRLFAMFEGVLFLVEGSPARAFDRVESEMEKARQDGELLNVLYAQVLLAGMYAEVALAPTPPLPELVRQAGFALTKGRKAKREARKRYELILAQIAEQDAEGVRFRVEYRLAHLLADVGDRDAAAAHLQSAIAAAEPAGETETLQEARRLLEELAGDDAKP